MITLALDERSARFVSGNADAGELLALGPGLLAERWLRHEPPTAPELEQAIEAVEDLVMPLHRRWPADPRLRATGNVPGLTALVALAGRELSRDQLEALFDRAAALAQGRPVSSDPVLAQREVMAVLLLLREAMHHLGFTELQLEPG